MNRIVNVAEPVRPYRSRLREEQAEGTRARILEATLRIMATGIARVSVPAVARAAGVSVPTVYRHFGTKTDLLAALYPHIARRVGVGELVLPRSVDEIGTMVRAIYARLDAFGDLARAAMVSPASEEARRTQMPDRLVTSRRFLDGVAPGASKAVRERIARIMVVVTASSGLRMWRDQLGASADEAADDIEWLLRAAIAHGSAR
jgi:AcrR family transcriptional regulator